MQAVLDFSYWFLRADEGIVLQNAAYTWQVDICNCMVLSITNSFRCHLT